MSEIENKIEIVKESQMEKDSKAFLEKIDKLVSEYYIERTLTRIKDKTIPKGESADELIDEFSKKYSGEENLFTLLGKVNNYYFPGSETEDSKVNIRDLINQNKNNKGKGADKVIKNTPTGYFLASGAIMKRILTFI